MSGKNNIDKLVSDTFASQQLPVNEAHWSSTQSFIAAQRRKRKRVVAFWFLGLLLMGSMGYLAMNSIAPSDSQNLTLSTENTASAHQAEQMDAQKATLTERTSGLDKNGKSGKSETPIHISGTNGVSLLAAEKDSSLKDSLLATTTSGLTINETNEENPKGEVSISFSLSVSNGQDSSKHSANEENNRSETPESKQTTFPRSTLTAAVVLESDTPVDPKTAISEVTAEISVNDVRIADNATHDTTLLQDSLTTSRTTKVRSGSSISNVDAAPTHPGERFIVLADSAQFKDSLIVRESNEILDNDSVMAYMPKEPSDSISILFDSLLLAEKRSLKGFFFMPYFGPSLSLKDLKGDDIDLIEKRKNEERDPITTDIGIVARYGFSNGIYLGSGFNYYKMGENARYSAFDIVNENQVPHTYFTYKDTGYLKYTDWDTAYLPFKQTVYTAYEWITETDSTEVLGEKTIYDTLQVPEKSVNNRFSYVEIPLLVGYQIPMGKWTIGADVGTGVNFLVKAQGNYPNLETGDYPGLTTSEYRLLTYTFLSNLSLGRDLGDHWGVYGNLRFRQQLTSPQKSTAMLDARYRSIGFQFKLNYRF